MDYTNRYFQEFLRMKDSEVEKILGNSDDFFKNKYFTYFDNIIKPRYKDSYRVIGENVDSYYDICDVKTFNYNDYIECKNFYKYNIPKNNDVYYNFAYKKAVFYYGEDKVWKDNRNNSIIIYFPTITISNSQGGSHIMRDLYVKLKINNKTLNILLARTTVLDYEYQHYLFSHCNGTRLGRYSGSLCFGDTVLQNNVKKCINSFTINYTSIDYIISSLYGYLSWESLEGTPYYTFTNIENHIYNYDIERSYSVQTDTAIKYLISNNFSFGYTLNKDICNRYNLRFSSKCLDEMETLLNTCKELDKFICFKGVSCSNVYKQSVPTTPSIDISEVYFKHEKINLKIIESEEKIFEKSKIHSRLITSIQSILEPKLLDYLIKKENE